MSHIILLTPVFPPANATPAFEGRGGEALATSISRLLARSYSSTQARDLSKYYLLDNLYATKITILTPIGFVCWQGLPAGFSMLMFLFLKWEVSLPH